MLPAIVPPACVTVLETPVSPARLIAAVEPVMLPVLVMPPEIGELPETAMPMPTVWPVAVIVPAVR